MRTSLKSPILIGDTAPKGAICLSILADAIQRPRRMAFAISFTFLTLIAFQEISIGQTRTWTNANPGDLLSNSNWDGSAPNGVGATALINSAPSNTGGFFLNSPMTLGALSYNNPHSRSIGGGGILNFQTSSGNALFHTTSSAGSLDLHVPTILLSSSTQFRIESPWGALISSSIQGSGGLIKTGTSNLALIGNNSYSGGTTVSAGTLQIGAGGTTGSIIGNITNNSRVVFNRSNAYTFSGVISGSGFIEKRGGGVLTLSGVNSYAGGTNIYEGTLQLGGSNRLPVGNWLNVWDGATFKLNNFNQSIDRLVSEGSITLGSGTLSVNNGVVSGVISGSGSLVKEGPFSWLYLMGANTFSGGTTIAGGTLSIGDNTTTGSISGNVTNNGRLLFNRSNAYTYNGNISGSGDIEKWANGVLTLGGNHTYAGSTIIRSGTLQLGAANRLPDGTRVSISSGATFNLNNFSETIGDLDGFGNIVLGSGTLTINSSFQEDFFQGVISGSGSLVKAGAFNTNLVLTGANTYSGGTTVSAGTLTIGGGTTTGSITGDIINNRQLAFNRSNAYTYSGAISGSGYISKYGSGVLTLNGNNTYAGSTNIYSGTLQLGSANRLPDATHVFISSGAVFNLNNFNETIGSLAGVGNVTLGSGTLTTGGNHLDTSFGGMISGSGGLVKRGIGTFTVSNNNTYSGRTLVEGGTLQVSGASGQISNSSAFVVGDANGNGNLTIQGGGRVNVVGTGSFIPGSTIGGVDLHSGRSYLGLNPGSVGTATVTGAGSQWESQNALIVGYQGTGSLIIQSGGVVKNTAGFLGHDDGGFGSVTVTGAGSKWENSGNVYVGLDGIGNLIVNNSGLVSANELHVGFGSTLSGSGGIVQADVYNQGTLSPGSSAGILTIDGFYFQESAGVLKIELGGLVAGSGYDQLFITNNAILEGALEVSLINSFQLDENQWFDIVDVGGNLTGTFLGLGEGALVGNFGGHDLFVTYQAGDGNSIALYTSAIPEPGAGILMLMGIAVSLGFYRRRR